MLILLPLFFFPNHKSFRKSLNGKQPDILKEKEKKFFLPNHLKPKTKNECDLDTTESFLQGVGREASRESQAFPLGHTSHSYTDSYLRIYFFERWTEISLMLPQRPVSGSTPWITETVFFLLYPLAKGTVNFSCSRSSWGHPSFWSLSSSLPTTLNKSSPELYVGTMHKA